MYTMYRVDKKSPNVHRRKIWTAKKEDSGKQEQDANKDIIFYSAHCQK